LGRIGDVVMSTEDKEVVNSIDLNQDKVLGQISKEDLQTIREAQQEAYKAEQDKLKAIADAEKQLNAAKIAELVAENTDLKFRNVLNSVYLKYQFKPEYAINLADGSVRLNAQKPTPTQDTEAKKE
jgi:hypothetical protein